MKETQLVTTHSGPWPGAGRSKDRQGVEPHGPAASFKVPDSNPREAETL